MNRHDYRIDRLHDGKENAAHKGHRGEPTAQHKSWDHTPKPLAVQREEAAEESRYMTIELSPGHWLVVPRGEPLGVLESALANGF
jgi:hypothetical protein